MRLTLALALLLAMALPPLALADETGVGVGGGDPPSGWNERTVTALWTSMGAVATVGAAGLTFYWPRIQFRFASVIAPFFARLRKEHVMENTVRETIVETVTASPGISVSDLRRSLACGWGTLVYHLRVLEEMRIISSIREGRHRRLFVESPVSASERDALGLLANAASRRILDAIRATPGLNQRQVARSLALSPGAVRWQFKRLASAGLLASDKDGHTVHYFPTPRLIGLMAHEDAPIQKAWLSRVGRRPAASNP